MVRGTLIRGLVCRCLLSRPTGTQYAVLEQRSSETTRREGFVRWHPSPCLSTTYVLHSTGYLVYSNSNTRRWHLRAFWLLLRVFLL